MLKSSKLEEMLKSKDRQIEELVHLIKSNKKWCNIMGWLIIFSSKLVIVIVTKYPMISAQIKKGNIFLIDSLEDHMLQLLTLP